MQSYSFQQQSGYASTSAACRELRSNDKDRTYLYLELSGNSNVNDLVDAMAVNTTVNYVDMQMHTSFSRINDYRNEAQRLFRAIGALPKLKTLKIRSRNHAAACTSVAALTQSLVCPNNQLVELVLWRLELEGSPEDFEALGAALRGCQRLKICRFYDCHLQHGETLRTCTLDPVVRGLSQVPTLQTLLLGAVEEGRLGTISGETLGLLGTFPSLESFQLNDFVLHDAHVAPMACAAVTSTTLQELVLGKCHLTPLGFRELATMLQGGSSRLTKLGLHLQDGNDNCLSEIIHTLETSHLTKLVVKGKLSKANASSFIQMIETNHKLKTLELHDSGIFFLQRTIRFYVTLNNAGRGHLLGNENATEEQWLQALHCVNQDLDGLFYFLIRNPTLCSVDT